MVTAARQCIALEIKNNLDRIKISLMLNMNSFSVKFVNQGRDFTWLRSPTARSPGFVVFDNVKYARQ